MATDANEEKLKSLKTSSLDEEDDEDEHQTDVFDDDDDEDEEDRVSMTLGFAVTPENPWSLLRQYFPSKAGGTPAWLDPIHLPSGKSSLCDFCGEPLKFLLQVYAPLPEESTFHRTLFVLMCPSMTCLLRDQHEQWKRHPEAQSRSVKVFRCQLPKVNSFYSSKAPAVDGTEKPLTAGALLCNWCGTWKGDKFCSRCRKARYCSGNHQTSHWRSTNMSHRVLCRQLGASDNEPISAAATSSLWPEYEITNEEECDFEDDVPDDNESSNALVSKSRADGSFGQLETYLKGQGDNRSWASFQERISLAPKQILRYSSSALAKPLWPVSSGRPSSIDIPKCNYCGGKRGFEFQVLPQLLYFFHVQDNADSLDWATIVVYTCEGSCDGPVGYKDEFAWVQLTSQSISPPITTAA
ncbi:hypothetical protein CASFOL_009926 [Castilleja foliolosa]|uniref:MYND-type domain-containing protein n=1 Tax=Castilleja foliolosa TaxID=1961234 RepID=A0ABD3DSM9_9LAMI